MASSTNGRKASEIFQGQALLYKHLYAFVDSMCLKWTVELVIPNIIHNHGKPITLEELVSILKAPHTKVGNVQSLMRYLAHNGFFEIVRIKENNQEEKEVYGLTAASDLLVKGTDLCLAPLVEFVLDPTLSGSYYKLKKWIYAEDLSLFGLFLGSHFYEFLNRNPENSRSFDEAMASDSQIINFALKDCSSVFEGLKSIVDVGGGTGTTAKLISEIFPELKSSTGCGELIRNQRVICWIVLANRIVLDKTALEKKLVQWFCEVHEFGSLSSLLPSFLSSIVKSFQIKQYILHNWTDKECIKILEKCKEAISRDGKSGKVIIIDVVINGKKIEHGLTQLKLLLDITMASLNGKERNEEEWKKLFTEAGFQDYKISPFTGFLSLIEIYP